MKFVKWLIILVAALLGIFLIITMFLPKEYSVSRTVVIEAPAPLIYSQVADLEAWQEWNPWNDMDPDMIIHYGDKTTGQGANYTWESEVAGNGSMEIVSATPLRSVKYELLFEGWEELPSYSEIALSSADSVKGTEVTWSFEGSVGERFFSRWMTVMMDKFVGASYEDGLQSLKERCEALAKDPSSAAKTLAP